MDMWITLVYAAILGGILWAVLDLTRRGVQSLRRRTSEVSGRLTRSGAVAATLENTADIAVKGACK